MRNAKKAGRTLAYVEWDDACSQKGAVSLRRLDDRYPTYSAGVLIRQTKHSVALAQQILPPLSTGDTEETYKDVLHIPLAMIRRIRKVRV